MLFPSDYYAWSDADKAQQLEAANALKAAIERLRPGERMTIAPGNYRLPKEGLTFIGLHDISVAAHGATFWVENETSGGLIFQNCENVSLQGAVFDMASLPWLQATVISVEGPDIIARLEPYFVKRFLALPDTHDFRMMFLLPDGSEEYDSKDCFIRKQSIRFEPPCSIAFSISPKVFQHWQNQLRRPQTGDRLVMGIRHGGGMIVSIGCGGMSFEDITIYASSGFAFFEQDFGKGGNTYRRCRLIRRPDTERLLACAADGFHSYNQRTGPMLEDCEISWTMDDLLNIHGFFSTILEQPSPNELLVTTPYGTHINKDSELELYSAPYGASLGEVQVTECAEIPGSCNLGKERMADIYKSRFGLSLFDFGPMPIHRLKLSAPVAVQPGDFLGDYTHCGAGAIIRNCHFHDSHVRGLLIKTTHALLENNHIENIALSGIILKPEFAWLEGPMPRNITIRGNVLENCSRVYSDTAPICVMCGCCPPPIERITGIRNFQSIHIISNTVRNSNAGPAICISNVDNLEYSGNTLENTWANHQAANEICYSNRIDLNSFKPFAQNWQGIDADRPPILVF